MTNPIRARLDAVLSTKTGAVVINDTVVVGTWLGAQVREEVRLVNPATSEFVGSIRVTSRSA
jgi:hypothetical protein